MELNIYCFDVDMTLDCGDGPVSIIQLSNLRSQGHIIGLCGNWPLFVQRVKGWHQTVAFMGPVGENSKASFLRNIKVFIPADKYIYIGNEGDRSHAKNAEWVFVLESEFKEGL